MLYVVVEELILEMSQGRHSNLGTVFFAAGFSVIMTPDVAQEYDLKRNRSLPGRQNKNQFFSGSQK